MTARCVPFPSFQVVGNLAPAEAYGSSSSPSGELKVIPISVIPACLESRLSRCENWSAIPDFAGMTICAQVTSGGAVATRLRGLGCET